MYKTEAVLISLQWNYFWVLVDALDAKKKKQKNQRKTKTLVDHGGKWKEIDKIEYFNYCRQCVH